MSISCGTNRIQRRGRDTTHRGITTVYAIIMMSALVGFVSFGVDWGRLQLAKTQLQQAADSAARAAVANLSGGVTAAQNAAVAWGGYNTADGSTVVINPTSDVVFGTWDPVARTFTVLTGSAQSNANAIQVWARRQAARGNAINLQFGAVIGEPSCDANMYSIAYSPSSSGYYFVGMNSIQFQNNTIKTDSYASASGAYNSGTAGSKGYLASNGNVTLSGGNITVSSGLYMLSSKTLSTSGSVSYGTRNALSGSIVWPTPSLGSYATSNDNSVIGLPTGGAAGDFSSGSFTVPSGVYYFTSLTMSGGTITISGPTTVYLSGATSITGGQFVVSSGHPSDLTFKVVNSSSFTVSGGSPLYADIQDPSGVVNISGITDFYGRAVGSNLNVTGSVKLHADTSVPAVSGASTPGGSSGSGITVVH